MTAPFRVLEKKPIPRLTKRCKYPWGEVVAGKPILIVSKKIQHVSSTAYAAARRRGVKFTLRSVNEGVEVHLSAATK